jgi:hypothetical protein
MSIQSDGTSVAGSPASVSGAVGFRDPTALTKWLKIFLWLDIAASAIALASKLIELPLLNLEAGNELVLVAYDGNELLKDIIALLRLPILITTIVLFAIWIYRANHNARQLGASGMAFSPGWSVGCYFVPIANLLVPYFAMREIWQASAAPMHWQQQPRGPILPWWWALFLLSNLLNNAAFRFEGKAPTVPDLVAGSLSAFTNVVDIASTATALVLVAQIFRMQMAHRAAAAFD